MASWLFDRSGHPEILFDGDKLRSSRGVVIGWISGENVYSLNGHHAGWFEGGVVYDRQNRALAFLADAGGHLPSRPGLAGTPGVPGFSGVPGRPGFSGTPGRPGMGGWSNEDLSTYF
jgi:hypothetical protein